MAQGLMFNVENPYGPSTEVMGEAGKTMGASTRSSTTTNKEEATTQDYLDTAASLAGTGLAVKAGIQKSTALDRANKAKINAQDQIRRNKVRNAAMRKTGPSRDMNSSEAYNRTYGVAKPDFASSMENHAGVFSRAMGYGGR